MTIACFSLAALSLAAVRRMVRRIPVDALVDLTETDAASAITTILKGD